MQTAWSLAASVRSLSSYLSAIDEAGAAGAKERRATPKLHTRAARPVGGAAVAGGAVPRGRREDEMRRRHRQGGRIKLPLDI